MALAKRLALEVADEGVRLEPRAKFLLHKLERRVLAHPAGHVASRGEEGVELLADLARLDGRPERLAQLGDLSPHARERGPDGLEVANLLHDGLEAVVANELEVEGLLGASDRV